MSQLRMADAKEANSGGSADTDLLNERLEGMAATYSCCVVEWSRRGVHLQLLRSGMEQKAATYSCCVMVQVWHSRV